MAEPAAARVKAAQIRSRVDAGKPVSSEHRKFLDEYIKRTGFAKAKALPAGSSPAPRSAVQSTTPQNDNVDPATHTWVPTIPIPLDDAPPPPPGASAPPTPGAPVIDATQPAPTGDPAAALQFAAFIALVTKAGLKASLELVGDKDLPEDMRAILADPEHHNEVVTFCAQAAYRVAVKRNFKAIPFPDEAICAAAVVGSAFAYLTLHKRKRKAAEEHREPSLKSAPRIDEDAPAAPTVTPPGFSWGNS